MSLVETTKSVYELLKAGASMEAKEQLMQLREEALDLQEQNLTLRERVRELVATLAQSDEMVTDRGVYWREGEQGRDGPFCTRCHDVDTCAVRLQDYGSTWFCANCKAAYEKAASNW